MSAWVPVCLARGFLDKLTPLGLPVAAGRSEICSVRAVAKNDGKWDAMRRLLDDDSPKVRQAVLSELVAWKEDGLRFLSESAQEKTSSGEAALGLLRELGWDDGRDAFRQFIRAFSYELESGFLLLDKVIRPSSDLIVTRQRLDQLAKRCEELTVLPTTLKDRCRTISRVLFHEEGLRGVRADFNQPASSSLSFALEEKHGLPLTLSVIYLLVARRFGLKLDPVELPGHFMVGCFLGKSTFYVDAFERGRMRNPEEVMAFLHRRNLDDSPQWFLPSTVGDVLRRACRNLVHQHLSAGNAESARLFSSFGNEFDEAYRRAS